MFLGFWNTAKANKENILYTIVTIFLLERVRRGWNRIGERGRSLDLPAEVIERRQHGFAFRAAALYALPLLLPTVKYFYRSIDELARYVGGLEVLSNLWALALVALVVEGFLSVLIYNLLGIYVERMNSALGFFGAIGRSVVDGSRLAVNAGRARVRAGVSAGVLASEGVGRRIVTGTRMVGAGLADGSLQAAAWLLSGVRRGPVRLAGTARRLPARACRLVASRRAAFKQVS